MIKKSISRYKLCKITGISSGGLTSQWLYEFLEISKIDTPEKANDLKTKIYEYSKKERNFREYIDIAFLGVVVMAVLTPIIEYAQSVYIPNSLSSFNRENILIYLSTTFPIVALPISIIHSLTSVGNVNSTAL